MTIRATKHSVSIPPHQNDFIKKQGYSLSKLLQLKIRELMQSKKVGDE